MTKWYAENLKLNIFDVKRLIIFISNSTRPISISHMDKIL